MFIIITLLGGPKELIKHILPTDSGEKYLMDFHH